MYWLAFVASDLAMRQQLVEIGLMLFETVVQLLSRRVSCFSLLVHAALGLQ